MATHTNGPCGSESEGPHYRGWRAGDRGEREENRDMLAVSLVQLVCLVQPHALGLPSEAGFIAEAVRRGNYSTTVAAFPSFSFPSTSIHVVSL